MGGQLGPKLFNEAQGGMDYLDSGNLMKVQAARIIDA